MNNQVKLIDSSKILWELALQGFATDDLKRKVNEGAFDPDTPPVPTIKPGDKVRITDAMDEQYIGKEDIVTRISGSAPYSTRLKDSPGDWPLSSLEVVE